MSMCSAPAVARLRVGAPVVASASVVITLITCVTLTKTRDIYTGGLKWPYFSDMGRDAPGYYVFCVGLSLVAITLAMTWSFNYQFQHASLLQLSGNGTLTPWVGRWAKVTLFLGVLSVIGLPTLAFFSTSSYPDVHIYGAYWFFFIETIAIFINTIVSYKIYKGTASYSRTSTALMEDSPDTANLGIPPIDAVRRTFKIQIVMFSLFFVAFLLYMPIGMAVIQDFQRLTIQECLERDLGQAYCKIDMRLDETRTKLWNYENDFAASQMRAVGQLGCILTLVGYSVSFLSHEYKTVIDGPRSGYNSTETSE